MQSEPASNQTRPASGGSASDETRPASGGSASDETRPASGGSAIRVRKPSFRFDAVPRHWLFGSPVATHVANALNLVFPAGERFFIRSVRHFESRITDPALREAVRAFMGQEVRHGMEHERFFERLTEQGLEIESFLAWYQRLAYQVIEKRCPPELNLSVTVACEHFTAMFAERALKNDVLSLGAPDEMRKLLLWHACEELEHKSVAFDVLQAVNPSYPLRVAGLFFASTLLLFFWGAGTRHLLKQEPKGAARMSKEEMAGARQHNVLLNGAFARAFFDYLRPDFHPSQREDAQLAAEWMARNEASLGGT